MLEMNGKFILFFLSKIDEWMDGWMDGLEIEANLRI